MEKINIAEILRHCPKGMELDSPIIDNLHFDCVTDDNIKCYVISDICGICNIVYFKHDGSYLSHHNAKCVIFPKGKTTWEGFQRPLKDGDILYFNYGGSFKYIAIFKQIISNTVYVHTYYSYFSNSLNIDNKLGSANTDIRFATEEEKQKLFKAIKDNGYKWNTETKTLEELVEPKFKVGDRIKKKGDTRLITIKDVRDNYYIITFLDDFGNCYITDKLSFSNQGDYGLVPNKFDITTLKPFDKVLVRQNYTEYWKPAFWGRRITSNNFPFITSYGATSQAIPFKSNEWLVGTTDNCDDYYKTW